MPNLKLKRKSPLSTFRRIAVGTWRTTYDPSVYGAITLRMDEALRYLDRFRAQTGKRITLTHMLAKAAAAALKGTPDANALLRLNRIYLRDRVGVFLQVVTRDPVSGEIDLTGMTIHDLEEKSLADIAEEIDRKAARARADKAELARSRSVLSRVPSALMSPALKLTAFLSYTLNLDLTRLGVPNDAFGSIMITNIGSLGLEEAYAPLVPYSRVPLLLAMGAVHDAPVVEDGAVVPGKIMRVGATFDHRILDGAHAAAMAETVRAWIERPFEHFDAVAGAVDAAADAADAAEPDASPGSRAGGAASS